MKQIGVPIATAEEISFEPVDRVDVTVLVDNFIDNTLKGSPGVSRPGDRNINEPLLAEHGLSLFVEILKKGVKSAFLLDTGGSPLGITYTGIINTINYGQKLGKTEKIYALIGGFHLTQASPDRITKTIQTLKEKEIDHLFPLHCTGFEAMASIWQALPRKFIIPSVGTKFEL